MTNKETLLPIAIKIGPFKNSGDFSITNSYRNLVFLCSVGFCFSLFFVLVFISCSFDLVCFLPLLAIEKCLQLPITAKKQTESKEHEIKTGTKKKNETKNSIERRKTQLKIVCNTKISGVFKRTNFYSNR